jgi:hypothetical protein
MVRPSYCRICEDERDEDILVLLRGRGEDALAIPVCQECHDLAMGSDRDTWAKYWSLTEEDPPDWS